MYIICAHKNSLLATLLMNDKHIKGTVHPWLSSPPHADGKSGVWSFTGIMTEFSFRGELFL